MSGSQVFGPTKDFRRTSAPSGKPILVFDPTNPARFTDLADTIAAYTGHANKLLAVNPSETGITVLSLTSTFLAITDRLDAIEALLGGDPIQLGADIDFEQFELMNLRLHQVAGNPASPVNGQLWYDTTANVANVYQNNAVQPFFTAADAAKLAEIDGNVTTLIDDVSDLSDLIDDIADDGLLSRSEKPIVHKEYDAIIAEQAGIDAEAVRHSVTTEKTTYDNKITTLTNYITNLNPAYDNYDADTVIDRATFMTRFNDVYAARIAVLNKISENTFTSLEAAAQEADEAHDAADTAAVNAALAIAEVGSISSDGVLSKSEKIKIILQVSIITTEQAGIDTEATEHGVTGSQKTNYDNAVTALDTYLDTLSPVWDDTDYDTNIDREDFNAAFALVYSTRQILLNAIARAAMDAAETADGKAVAAQGLATSAQNAAQSAYNLANNAENHAQQALGQLDVIADDGVICAGTEKATLIREVSEIDSEKTLLDAQAVIYELSSADYDTAVTALHTYLNGLSNWNNPNVDTTIDRETFDGKFKDVYDESVALYLLIYDAARDAAITAASTAADEAHAARTKELWDGGFCSAGRFEVGDQAWGNNNAGIDGLVSAGATDIRFWAGSTAENRTTAPFRVQHDGTMYSTKGYIGGWTIATDAIHYGTKHTEDGYATDGLTLANDGSLHAKNFYINDNGDIGLKGIISFDTASVGGYNIKMVGQDIYENNHDGDWSRIKINRYGYNGTTDHFRATEIGDGKGNVVFLIDNSGGVAATAVTGKFSITKGPNIVPASLYFHAQYTDATRDAAFPYPDEGMMIYNNQLHRPQFYNGSTWINLP